MEKKWKKTIKIFFKVTIIIVLILIIFNRYKEADYSELSKNTYYNNIMVSKERYRLANVKKFIKCIEEVKYDEAYAYLSDKCKEEKFHNNVESFKDFIKTYLIDYNKPEKNMYYDIIPENESSKNIRVRFSIKDVNDYYDAPIDKEGSKYYDVNILDIIIEEKSLLDYKYYIELYK